LFNPRFFPHAAVQYGPAAHMEHELHEEEHKSEGHAAEH
jgi:hypothetical protein